jgi:uncharacterized protein (TIGR02118 family)
MAKVIFVLHRRANMTREQCLEHWSSEQHTSILKTVPGVTRLVQNLVVAAPSEPICDGIGELWFESDDAMGNAVNSPEMRRPSSMRRTSSTWRRPA